MSRAVWRYQLDTVADTKSVPAGAQVRHVGWSRDGIQIWLEVDPAAPTEPRTFLIFGTGVEIPESGIQYVGSIVAGDEFHVFHIYESRPQ